MVNLDDTNTPRNSTNSVQGSRISEPTQTRNPLNREKAPNDDVIMSLANAYENKRARQVSEWEHMRRSIGHAA